MEAVALLSKKKKKNFVEKKRRGKVAPKALDEKSFAALLLRGITKPMIFIAEKIGQTFLMKMPLQGKTDHFTNYFEKLLDTCTYVRVLATFLTNLPPKSSIKAFAKQSWESA